jgi:hypothetical protein
MSSRSARPLVAALLALLLLGACTGRHPDPTGYGDTTKTNFSKGCLETAKQQDNISDPNAYCTCSYNKIVATVPFSKFKEINSDLSDDPAPLPEPLASIAADCVKSTNSSS